MLTARLSTTVDLIGTAESGDSAVSRVALALPARPWSHPPATVGSYRSNVTESTALEATAQRGTVELLQAVADPVRWTVLATLAEGPRCVCRLQEQVTVPANLLSYHLKVLRDYGLVTTSRRGRWIDYSLADDALGRLRDALPGARCGVA